MTTPLPINSTRRCDCEADFCDAHRAGGCTARADVAVTLYGMKTVLCDRCAEEAARTRLTAHGRL